MKIKWVDLGYDAHNGMDYYSIYLDLRNGDLYAVKNAGCDRAGLGYCCEVNGLEYDGVTMNYFIQIYWNEDVKGVPHQIDMNRVYKKYQKFVKGVEFVESARKSKKLIREMNEKRVLDNIYDYIINYNDYDVNGMITLDKIELDDRFFIPNSSFAKFPKKRPSTNSYTFKAFIIDEKGNEIPIGITCNFPWDENLSATGKTWKDITSYMIFVQYVYRETF